MPRPIRRRLRRRYWPYYSRGCWHPPYGAPPWWTERLTPKALKEMKKSK